MREIVLRAIRDMNPTLAKCRRKDARRGVDRHNLVGVPYIRAHIFYRLKFSHAVSGLSRAKNRLSVSDLMRGCNDIARVDLFILAVSSRKTKNP